MPPVAGQTCRNRQRQPGAVVPAGEAGAVLQLLQRQLEQVMAENFAVVYITDLANAVGVP
jgi:hypothetical protein